MVRHPTVGRVSLPARTAAEPQPKVEGVDGEASAEHSRGHRRRGLPEHLRNYERRPLPALDRIPFQALSRSEIHDLLNDHIKELRDHGIINSKGRSETVRLDFATNVSIVYDEFRKAAFRTKSGQGYTGWKRLAQSLYPDITGRDEDYRKKTTSMQRWMRALVVIGVLHYEPEKDQDGAWRALRWRLESEPPCRRSSVGGPTRSGLRTIVRTRRESHRQRLEKRVRRHCHGAGHKASAPLEFEPAPFFPRMEMGTATELAGGRPVGAPPASKGTTEVEGATEEVQPESRCARTHDRADTATHSEGPAEGGWAGGTQVELRAALRAGREPAELLSRRLSLEEAPWPDLDFARNLLVVSFEHAFGRPALYSPGRWDERLAAVLERFDRYAGHDGAGVTELLEWIELHSIAFRTGLADPSATRRSPIGVPAAPRSLALYVTEAENQLRAPDARLDRRIARWRRFIDQLGAEHDVPDELRDRFERFLAEELRRRGEGRWCRVRRAARRALEQVNSIRADHGLPPLRHRLYGADNPRWRGDRRNY